MEETAAALPVLNFASAAIQAIVIFTAPGDLA
jgi:hypothetical protein